MTLDVRTLVAALAVSLLMIGVGMLVTARTYPDHLRRGALRWGQACILEAIGWTLLGLRGSIPDVLSIVLANPLLTASVSLLYLAIGELERTPRRSSMVYGPPAVVLCTFIYYGALVPNFAIRSAVLAGVAAFQMLVCASQLLRRARQRRLITHVLTGVAFLLCGAVLTVRTFDALLRPRSNDPSMLFHADPAQQVFFLLMFVTVYLLSFGFVLMCNESFNEELMRLATLDSLTERFNRRTIEDLARREAARSRRGRLPLSVAILDLDHFKRINDTFGHPAGDAALRHVGELLQGLLRSHDLLGRYGGEEFLVVMPETDEPQAAVVAERLRSEVERAVLALTNAEVRLTTSIGVAQFAYDGDSFDAALRNADEALYAAKALGRNCVVAASRLAARSADA